MYYRFGYIAVTLMSRLGARCVQDGPSYNQCFKPIFHCDCKTLALGIQTRWYLKSSNLRHPLTRTLTFALPPLRVSGIKVALGPKCKILVLAMYISLFFGVDFIRVGSNFSVEYGLKVLVMKDPPDPCTNAFK